MLTIPPWRLTKHPIAASRIAVVAGAAELRMAAARSSTDALGAAEAAESHHRQDHDCSLEQIDQVDRDITEELDHRSPVRQRPEEERGQQYAEGVLRPSRATAMPRKAVAGKKRSMNR